MPAMSAPPPPSPPALSGRLSWRRLAVVPVAAAQLVVATLAASSPSAAIVLVGGLAMAVLALLAPLAVLVAAFPSAFAYWRVGPASIDMSVTDAVTILGAVAALPFVPWRSPALRRVLVATLAYGALLGLTVVAHPAMRSIVEVGHRASMVVGAVLIGAAVARMGRVRLALRAFLVAAVVVSLASLAYTLTHGLEPAYPFGIQKNAAGEIIVMGLVILLAASRRVELRPLSLAVVAVVLVVGLAASQSRGAALALIAVFALHLVRSRNRESASRLARLAPLLLVASIGLLAITAVTYRDRDLNPQTEKFNALNSRLDTYDYAIHHEWLPNILDGGGLKWFFAPDSPVGPPHDLFVGELSETGLIGLVGLVVLLVVLLNCMRRSSSDLGEAGFLVLVARILESLVGIFWTAGPGTLPFLVLGLVIGDEDLGPDDQPSRRTRWTPMAGAIDAAP
jgi:O-antigen ligase